MTRKPGASWEPDPAVKELHAPNAPLCDSGKTPHHPRDHTSARVLRLRKLLLESVL